MAIPLSAIRKYTPEIIALSFVAIVLGAFWSIIDTYQPSYLLDLRRNTTHLHNAHNATNLTPTIPPIIEVDLRNSFDDEDKISVATPASINATNNEIDNTFAISAEKVIKYALTGKLNDF